MTIGEGLLVGLVLLGFFCFGIVAICKDTKIMKEQREFRDSVKKTLSGINKELKCRNDYFFSEVNDNEN